MKRKQIVERIAMEREVPLHTAADWLDSFLHELMQQLKGYSSKGPAETKPPTETEVKGRPADTQ